MFKVYNFPLDPKKHEIEQPFSLYQLMHGIPNHPDERTREGDCYITGIRFEQKGSAAFDEYVQNLRNKFIELEFTHERIENFINDIKSENRITIPTKFAAMIHPIPLDGCPYNAFMTDFNTLAIIHAKEKRIALIPYDEKGHHRKLFYDINGAKMAGVRWQYDGILIDALNEFADTYSFDIGRNPSNFKEAIEVMKDRDPSKKYILTEKHVALEKAIEFISR